MRKNLVTKLVSLIGLLLLLGGLYFIWPHSLGGATSQIMVSGSSMLPTLRQGDLVVLRKARSYAVGDVVAYPPSPGGPLVIHRILGREGERFTFQGDNNKFVDPWKATSEQITGKQLLAIPRVGAYLSSLKRPWMLAAVVGFMFFYMSVSGYLLASPLGTRGKRRNRRMRASRRGRGLAWLLS